VKPTLFIIERPTPQRAPVLNALHRRGLSLEVIYLHGDPAEQGWGSLHIDHPHSFAHSHNGLRAHTVASRILRGDYAVLVSMGYRGSIRIAALTAARAVGLPIAMRFDTNQLQIEGGAGPKRAGRRLLMRATIPRSSVAWSIGQQNRRFWQTEIGLHSIVDIPYEVPLLPGNLDAFTFTRKRESNPETLRFLYVGRLAPIKRINDAIQAFHATPHPRWTFHIVGSGPDDGRLRNLASGDHRISFMGSKSYRELGAEFEQSDVLVLPSQGEPWGLVVNEALGYGLRVIASDQVGAAHDLLSVDTGQIYPVGDVAALTSAMEASVNHLHQSSRHPTTDTAALMEHEIKRMAGVIR
jgi:glycosyltransferase involved in cell wall biosynthesis